MENIDEIYQFILEMNRLKSVFRTTITQTDRRESTAEHSWSASMIVLLVMPQLKQEFQEIDELKVLKLVLIHDIVEIYAGDVIAFDAAARKDKEAIEAAALEKLMLIHPEFGKSLYALWHEFEDRKTLEAKIAKAADAICPVFMRLHVRQTYKPINVDLEKLTQTKQPSFEFSKTFSELFEKLKLDLVAGDLI